MESGEQRGVVEPKDVFHLQIISITESVPARSGRCRRGVGARVKCAGERRCAWDKDEASWL